MISEFATQNNPRILDKKKQRSSEPTKCLEHLPVPYKHCGLAICAGRIEREQRGQKAIPISRRNNTQKSHRAAHKMQIIAESKEKKRIYDTSMSIAGIVQKTVTMALALMPKIGTLSDRAVAKLVGLAPADQQSGKTEHTRHIYGGRKELRNGLYMSAFSAVRSNHILKPFYTKLKTRMPRGKASKWTLVQVMRKIIILINKIAQDPKFVPQHKPNSEKKMSQNQTFKALNHPENPRFQSIFREKANIIAGKLVSLTTKRQKHERTLHKTHRYISLSPLQQARIR